MRDTPLDELVPIDMRERWLSLVGHRRYHYSASSPNDAWIRTFLQGACVEVLAGDPRRMKMSAIRFNTFLVSHLRVPAIHFRLSRDLPPQQSRYLFLFVNHGSVEIQGSGMRWASPGGGLCIIFPGQEPVDMQSSDGTEMVLFTFDRREVAPHILTPSNVGNIERNSGVVFASYAYLKAVADAPPVAEFDEPTGVLRTLTLEVARALTKVTITDDHSADTFQRAQQIIARRSVDVTFDVCSLADECRVSRRTLARVFEREGLAPAQEIRRSRAQRAIVLLADDEILPLPEVARASGFSSVTTMTRALRAEYDLTPGLVRRTLDAPGRTST